jgi:hypothetical protein
MVHNWNGIISESTMLLRGEFTARNVQAHLVCFSFFFFPITPAHFAAGKEEGKKHERESKKIASNPPLKSSGRLQTIWQVRHHRFVGSEREKEEEKFFQWDRDGANNCVSQLMTVHAVALGSQKNWLLCSASIVDCCYCTGQVQQQPVTSRSGADPLHLKFNPSASAEGF